MWVVPYNTRVGPTARAPLVRYLPLDVLSRLTIIRLQSILAPNSIAIKSLSVISETTIPNAFPLTPSEERNGVITAESSHVKSANDSVVHNNCASNAPLLSTSTILLSTALVNVIVEPIVPTSLQVCYSSFDNDNLQRFWELESFSEKRSYTPDEELCESFFQKTHSRDEAGRYVVALPFKADPPPLVSGEDTEAKALALQQELIGICKTAGFELRKWHSNSPAILAALVPQGSHGERPENVCFAKMENDEKRQSGFTGCRLAAISGALCASYYVALCDN
ncbi:unnamed protein product, partial [Iphiclides podalirius]